MFEKILNHKHSICKVRNFTIMSQLSSCPQKLLEKNFPYVIRFSSKTYQNYK